MSNNKKNKGRPNPKGDAKVYEPRKRNSKTNNGYGEYAQRSNRTTAMRGAADLSPVNNPMSWYNRYPELIKSVASIPFPNKPGMTYSVMEPFSYFPDGYRKAVPGVITLEWVPFVGYATSSTDPINIAAYELYAKVRANYSGALVADAPDIMLYVLALDGILSYIASLKRIYRVLNTYSMNNLDLPYNLLSSLGISQSEVNTLIEGKQDLLFYTNDLIHKVARYKLPNVFDYINRHIWMNDRVYLDAPKPEAQMYVFNQLVFPYFKLDDSSAGMIAFSIAPWQNSATTITPKVLYDYGINMLEKLADYDEAYTISGYLMRAFESAPNVEIGLLEGSEIEAGVYSEIVLMQIHNARSTGSHVPTTDTFKYTITQANNNALQSKWLYRSSAITDPKDIITDKVTPFIDLGNSPVNEEMVVESTRLMTSFRNIDGNIYIDGGSEVVTQFRVSYGNTVVGFDTLNCSLLTKAYNTTDFYSSVKIALNAVDNLSAFDWHPYTTILYPSTTGAAPGTGAYTIGDVANVANLSHDQLAKIHRVCLLSEFNTYSF